MIRARRVGLDALLVEVADTAQALDLATWARARLLAAEVVPGACTVLLDGVRDLPGARATLAQWLPAAAAPAGEVVEVPVVYDGADLAVVAEIWGCPIAEVAERHMAVEFVSAFCGFAPGFAYLAGLPPKWAVPRRATPRTRVPTGSVALADTWCGVYPSASPGGWLLLGRTDVTLFDPGRRSPALLAPGTRVRFVGLR